MMILFTLGFMAGFFIAMVLFIGVKLNLQNEYHRELEDIRRELDKMIYNIEDLNKDYRESLIKELLADKKRAN